jgi:hypothetical protein
MPSIGTPASNSDGIGARAVLQGHGRRAAGEDDALRLEPFEGLDGPAERRDLAIDPRLADPPRDELSHLAPEIDDQDGFGGLDGHAGR